MNKACEICRCENAVGTYLPTAAIQQWKSSASLRDRLRVRMLFPGVSVLLGGTSNQIFFFFASLINNAQVVTGIKYRSDTLNPGRRGDALSNHRSPLCRGAPRVSVCLPPPSPSYRGPLFLLPPVICMHANHVTCMYRRRSIAPALSALYCYRMWKVSCCSIAEKRHLSTWEENKMLA